MRRIDFDPPENALTLERSEHSRTGLDSIGRLIPGVMELVDSYRDTIKKDWKPTTKNFPYDSHILAFETVVV